jgi:hypothetical protein
MRPRAELLSCAILSQEITCGRKGLGFSAGQIRFHWPALSAAGARMPAVQRPENSERNAQLILFTLPKPCAVKYPSPKAHKLLSVEQRNGVPLMRVVASPYFLVGSSPSNRGACPEGVHCIRSHRQSLDTDHTFGGRWICRRLSCDACPPLRPASAASLRFRAKARACDSTERPPLRPAAEARLRSCEKLRFSRGTLAPPLRAISRCLLWSIPAKPRKALSLCLFCRSIACASSC